MELTNEKISVLKEFYQEYPDFQKEIDSLLVSRYEEIRKHAEKIQAALKVESETNGEKKQSKKPGRKPMQKTDKVSTSSNGSKITHRDAIIQVLKKSEEPLSATEIRESLQNVKNYSPPNKSTLLTVLSNMKNEENTLKVHGSRPNSKYELAVS